MAPGFFPVSQHSQLIQAQAHEVPQFLELVPSAVTTHTSVITAISTFAAWRARAQPRNDAEPAVHGPKGIPRRSARAWCENATGNGK